LKIHVYKKNNGKDKKKGKDYSKRNESENCSEDKIEYMKRVKCFECSLYGLLRNECSSFKRNKKKSP
jgi:hypothetical protein